MLKGLTNLKIGTKLALLIGGFVAQLVCVVGVTFWGLNATGVAADNALTESVTAGLATDASNHINNVAAHVGILTLNSGRNPEITGRILELRKEYITHLEELAQTVTESAEKQQLERVNNVVNLFRDANLRVIELAESGKQAEAQAFYKARTVPAFQEIDTEMEKLVRLQEADLKENQSKRVQVAGNVRIILIALSLVTVGIGILIGVVLTRSITSPLHITVDHLTEIAQGSVSRQVPLDLQQRRDEFGTMSLALQAMTDVIKDRSILAQDRRG